MSDAPVDAAAVQRALQTAQLMAYSRHARTNLSVDKIDNIARVLLALNMVAHAAADLFAARDKLLAADPDPTFPAYAEADAAVAEAETALASALLALGYVQIPTAENQEATDGQ
ncbi:hypothetical protein [Ancylobacter sp. G4_0304]|uniref:hypothetical protein n=1 Tax=Ancylobacter sp. G4_0304 TaxID=3114289 RepID=UPI0039C62A4A